MVAGTLFLSNGRTAIAVRILDVNNPLNSQRTLYGNNALLFSATSSMKDVSNGELLGIISEAGGIALFQ